MVNFRKFWFLTGLLSLFIVSGCNSGGSSGKSDNSSKDKMNISGFVEDGAVVNAKVYIKTRGTGANFAGPVLTDEQGSFTFSVNRNIKLNDYYVLSIGGKDSSTGLNGVDFLDISMQAPLEMFENRLNAVVVSPVTTLVGLEVQKGLSLGNAENKVKQDLNFDNYQDLGLRPVKAGSDFLAKNMMITLTAVEMRKGGITSDPFEFIGFDAQGIPDITSYPQLKASFEIIIDSKDNIKRAFSTARLKSAVRDIMDINSSSPLNESSKEKFNANLNKFIEIIFNASDDNLLRLDSYAPERVARYSLVKSEISSYDDFISNDFDEKIKKIENDPEIKRIFASTAAVYDIKEKLFESELPGDDNLKKMEYYYKSNASHLYKAEKVINNIKNDELTDSVMVSIVRGKSEAGFFDEAESIINTQIFRVENKGKALEQYGRGLAKQNQKEKALKALQDAEAKYKEVAESRGQDVITKSDADNFASLSFAYIYAGYEEKVFDTFKYLENKLEGVTNPAIFARVIVPNRNVARFYIENNEFEKAGDIADFIFEICKKMPPDEKGLYKQNLHDLNDLADIYGKINRPQKVLDAYNEFHNILYNGDTLTQTGLAQKNTTKSYDEMFLALYKTGHYRQAESLHGYFANSKPRQSAILGLLSYIVKNKGIGVKHDTCPDKIEDLTGEDILAYKLELGSFDKTMEDAQIAALTYYNEKKAYIALTFINENDYENALKALDKAEAIIDTLPDSQVKQSPFGKNKVYMGSSKGYWGYAHIAKLYVIMKDYDKALSLLEKSEKILPYYEEFAKTGDTPEETKKRKDLYSMEVGKIAKCYLSMGDVDNAFRVWGEENGFKIDDYSDAIKAMIESGQHEKARIFIDEYIEKARDIFDNSDDENTHNEKNNKDEIKHLLNAGFRLAELNEINKAADIAKEAKERADQLFNHDDRLKFYINNSGTSLDSIIELYNHIGFLEDAVSLANLIDKADKKYDAFESIANYYAEFDAFEEPVNKKGNKTDYYTVANVDTDKDGKPDFFSPFATAEEIEKSGLIADDDCDNDGILDINDSTPLWFSVE